MTVHAYYILTSSVCTGVYERLQTDINTIQAFIGTCSTVDIITPQNARKELSLLPLTGLCLNSEVLSKHICTKLVGMQYRQLSWSPMLTPLTSISPVYNPFCVYVRTCVGGGGAEVHSYYQQLYEKIMARPSKSQRLHLHT